MSEEWQKVEPSQMPIWDEETQKEIQGIYKEKKTEVGPNKSKMYVIEQPNGDNLALWGNTVLDSRFILITIGSKVKIVFNGIKTSPKTKRQYKDYDVFVKNVLDETQDNNTPPDFLAPDNVKEMEF